MDIGEKIKTARRLRGLSQPGLAGLMGCTKQMVSLMEGGVDVRHSTLERVAKALDMRVSEIVAIGEEKERDDHSKK